MLKLRICSHRHTGTIIKCNWALVQGLFLARCQRRPRKKEMTGTEHRALLALKGIALLKIVQTWSTSEKYLLLESILLNRNTFLSWKRLVRKYLNVLDVPKKKLVKLKENNIDWDQIIGHWTGREEKLNVALCNILYLLCVSLCTALSACCVLAEKERWLAETSVALCVAFTTNCGSGPCPMPRLFTWTDVLLLLLLFWQLLLLLYLLLLKTKLCTLCGPIPAAWIFSPY